MRQEEYVSLLAVREICTHGGMMIRAVLRFTRLIGRYARRYGYCAASVSSMSTRSPGASPGCIMPSANAWATHGVCVHAIALGGFRTDLVTARRPPGTAVRRPRPTAAS